MNDKVNCHVDGDIESDANGGIPFPTSGGIICSLMTWIKTRVIMSWMLVSIETSDESVDYIDCDDGSTSCVDV